MKSRPITIARVDQRRMVLIARILKKRPSEAVASAMRLYYMYNEYSAIERGFDDPTVSHYAEELCALIGFDMLDDEGRPLVPAHRRVQSSTKHCV